MTRQEHISDKIRAIVEEFIRRLNSENIPVREAYIFGSYARGTNRPWSDIDVALVSDHFEGDLFEDRRKIIPTLVRLDSDIEPHPFIPHDFTEDNPFVREIIRTGVRIV